MNLYIPETPPKKREWYERDLHALSEDQKYEHFIKNLDPHFSNGKIINVDLIHHEYQGDKLNNPREYYETIKKCDFRN